MKEITLNGRKVRIVGFISLVPISLIMISPFWTKWSETIWLNLKKIKESLSLFDNDLFDTFITLGATLLVIFIGIIFHELIHGFFMKIFTWNTIGAVKFGFRKEQLVPYAHCRKSLISWQMLIVALAPFVLLGLIPYLISLINGNLVLLYIGLVMTLSAVGDFIYAFLIIKTGLSVKIIDHDTEVGFRILND